VADVQEAVEAAGIALRVLGGAELAFEQLGRPPEELRRFGLAGNPALLLVETPYTGWPLALDSALFELRLAGFTIVLGHPERNPDVQADPGRVERLVASGALVQVTTSSLTGVFGRRPLKTGVELIERGFVHLVASDTHGLDGRSLGAGPVERVLGDEALARWLTEDSPAAIAAGQRVPPRPPHSSRRRFARVRRR
jgi:protein-tyrosine phosphatase